MKKFFSTAMAIVMMITIFGSMPFSVYADDSVAYDSSVLSSAESDVLSEVADSAESSDAVADDGTADDDVKEDVTEPELIDGVENTVITLSKSKFTYSGAVQRPLVTVADLNGEELVLNQDYTVSYSDYNSANAGSYSVTVDYIGDYSGSVEHTYTIEPETNVKPVLNRTVIQYTGTVQRPLVTVTDSHGKSLEYKKDFTVSYSNWNSKNAGTYTVTVNMQGNYSGSKTYEYNIVSATAALSRTQIAYVGTVQRPTVTAKDKNGRALVYKKDFTVSYSNWNSTNVGTYTVTVNYIGKYSGRVKYTYKIVPQTNVTPTLKWTEASKSGNVLRPTVTVKDKYGRQLVYKKDFTVSYTNWSSTNAGAYTVTVIMQGNYGGRKTYKYYIDEKSALPLNKKATHISYEYANVTKETFGKSYQGRSLEAFVITPKGKYTKTFVMTFAIHGFEDWYSRDGKVLTEEANALVEYYAKNPSMLKNFRLVIIPCLNPDGTIAGNNNNRANYYAFGRCTANHIDMNRDFPSCKAVESYALKSFLNKYKPDVFTDFHGWLDKSIGTSDMCYIYNKNMGLSKRNNDEFYGSYLYSYVHNTYRCPSVLLEYKSPYDVSHSQTYNSINSIISYYNKTA